MHLWNQSLIDVYYYVCWNVTVVAYNNFMFV